MHRKDDPHSIKFRITTMKPRHVEALVAMQRLVFPTLTEDELFSAAQYLNHIRLFHAGQFVALIENDGQEQVVGAASAFRTDFDFDNHHHTFLEAAAGGWLSKHDPEGEWLYGVDMSVHPDYRRRGVGSALYRARAALTQRLNLRGEIAGAMLPGYARYRHQMNIEDYVSRVVAGRLKDPTLTAQLRNGFTVRGLLYDHITDPRSNNCAALIVRENPAYEAIAAGA